MLETRLTSMPGGSDAFAFFEASNTFSDRDNVSNRLVAWDSGEYIAQKALLHETIGMTDPAGKDLYQDVAWAWQSELDIL